MSVPCAGVKAFIEDGKSRLLILRHALHESTKKPSWGLPGGHIEWDEEPEETLIREVRDEIGVEIEIGSLLFAWNKRISRDHQMVILGYRCRLKDPRKVFRLGPDDDAFHWLAPAELDRYFPKNDREYRSAILRYLKLRKRLNESLHSPR